MVAMVLIKKLDYKFAQNMSFHATALYSILSDSGRWLRTTQAGTGRTTIRTSAF